MSTLSTSILGFGVLVAGIHAAALSGRQTTTTTYSVPNTLPSNASPQLNAQPIGVSIEFFAFPQYITGVSSTQTCLNNLANVGGSWPPLRIGGTTQDRATYDSASTEAVTYSVADPKDAPANLTFGPKFMDLAGTYKGQTIIGFNRRLNNLTNTISAAVKAKSVMSNLYSIELGNEPNFFTSSDPINTGGGSWTAAKDFASQKSWQASVGDSLRTNNIFSAGVYFGTGSFNIPDLVNAEGTSQKYVKDFCSHNYPQGGGNYDLAKLMSHSGIASQVSQYKSQISAANAAGKPHIMGETNSATQGGGGISPTFGAALWVMDYSLQLLHLGSKAIYFHQGTVGNCQYCWWARDSMGSPYYGAYMASLLLSGADRLAPLDDFSSNYGGWVAYKCGKPLRVLLYNSDYYTTGTRPSHSYTLSGLSGASVSARRLTAASATARQDQGSPPSISGISFKDGTCAVQGASRPETVQVVGGRATFNVAASEALLVELQ